MDGKFHWDVLVQRKAISGTSSVGCSSRSIYYCGTAEGVPFKWETQPGTPKNNPPPQEILAPLSPPPAVLSLSLPKPCIEQPKLRLRTRLRFWRKSKKSRDCKRRVQATTPDYSNVDLFSHSDKLKTFSFFGSDCEFMASRQDSTSSLSSSSSSPSSINSRNVGRVSFERPSSCSHWQINRFMICYHS